MSSKSATILGAFCLLILSSCSSQPAEQPYQVSAFFKADWDKTVAKFLESQGQIIERDEQSWQSDDPEFQHGRIVLFYVYLRPAKEDNSDRSQAVFSDLKALILKQAQKGGVTIVDPETKENTQGNSKVSCRFRYKAASPGKGWVELDIWDYKMKIVRVFNRFEVSGSDDNTFRQDTYGVSIKVDEGVLVK